MSYCKREGDHTSLFVTQEDLGKPEVVTSLAEDEEFGVILPNGEINWDCPCLGGLPSGPCGQEFKDAFSCFHHSTAEDKGSDCIEQFKSMQECFQKFPDLYKDYDDDDDDGTEGKGEREGERGSSGGKEDGGGKVEKTGDDASTSEHTASASSDSKHQTSSSSAS